MKWVRIILIILIVCVIPISFGEQFSNNQEYLKYIKNKEKDFKGRQFDVELIEDLLQEYSISGAVNYLEYFKENYLYDESISNPAIAFAKKRGNCVALTLLYKELYKDSSSDYFVHTGTLNGEPHMWLVVRSIRVVDVSMTLLNKKVSNVDYRYDYVKKGVIVMLAKLYEEVTSDEVTLELIQERLGNVNLDSKGLAKATKFVYKVSSIQKRENFIHYSILREILNMYITILDIYINNSEEISREDIRAMKNIDTLKMLYILRYQKGVKEIEEDLALGVESSKSVKLKYTCEDGTKNIVKPYYSKIKCVKRKVECF